MNRHAPGRRAAPAIGETVRRSRAEGPEEVWKKFGRLNRRPPWDVLGHAVDLAGKLDLATGAAVVAVAEVATVFANDLIEDYLGAFTAGWLAVLLPLLLVVFHRKGKKSRGQGPADSGEPANVPRTPEQVAAAVKASEQGAFGRTTKRLKALGSGR